MKKLLLTLVAVCTLGLGAQAQEVFHKGDIVGNLQVGIGSYTGHGIGDIGFPPTSISVDVGAFDNLINGENGSIGLGGYYGFGTFRNVWKEDYIKYKNRTVRMCIGFRGTFHYQFVENLDTYLGVMFGLYTYNDKHIARAENNAVITDNRSASAGFAHSEFAGVRYYFSDSFGVGAEAGYGFTYLSAGITFKF